MNLMGLLIRGLGAAGLALALACLGTGCGSDSSQHHPQPTTPAQRRLARTCQAAAARLQTLRRDLDPVLADPSSSAADRRLDLDAQRLAPPLAALVSRANFDQQSALSQYLSELRDIHTALQEAEAGNVSTAKSLLSGVPGQLAGLPALLKVLCKT